MRLAYALFIVGSFWSGQASAQNPPPFQPLVDAAPEGGVLRPAPGVYAGPATIGKAMTIDGGGSVTITGNGLGTVVTLTGRQIVLQGLKIRDSGHRHENLDACLRLEGASFNVVKDNDLAGCLVGIDVNRADRNIFRRNRIQGLEPASDMRGDGLRVWYSNDNIFERNTIIDHRDFILEYSTRNVLTGNKITNGRYGTHFMYASGNVARDNVYENNEVGIFSMYASHLCLVGNSVLNSNGPSGFGLGFKEAGNLTVENNRILGNAIGIYLDDSPSDTDQVNTFRNNRIGFNGVAIQFHSSGEGNKFGGNSFYGNYTDVAAHGGAAAASAVWDGNSWDAYQGFDRSGRGVGDTPFEVYAYADRIWADLPMASYFRGSPLFESIDFLTRLAPFSKPQLILRDERPATRPIVDGPATCG